ncbi:MAG: diacylglycerol kinase family lipid kinase [Lachnospiraceae bacterium]|nr:diacylglycerol kinase family lipid kinase [Lachnospiraceae bacterium]
MGHKRLLFLYNSKAGKGTVCNHLSDMIDIFIQNEYKIMIHSTQFQGDAISVVQNLETGKYDLVICCGGDGTLDEVVTGMMIRDEKLPIGYIPAGSTNDFAHSLEISNDMCIAADCIMKGEHITCDVGSFNDDIFVYVAAFGMFTEVAYETTQDRKNVLGHMAYVLEGIKSLSSLSSYYVKIITDEMEIQEEIIFAMVSNSRYVGGIKNITGDNVKLDDGEFEVMFIKRPDSIKDLKAIISSLISRNMNSELVHCLKASHIKFVSEDPIKWTLDGEFGGWHDKVEIVNLEKAIVLVR